MTATIKPTILRCRGVLATCGRWIDGGGLVIERGRVAALLTSASALRRAGGRVHDLGDVVVTPGLVNAHVHLELSGCAGRTVRGRDFAAWVRAVIASRAQRTAAELAADARAGADQCLASGTTSVADIDSSGASQRGLRHHALRAWIYREVLDAHDARRTHAAALRVKSPPPRRARRHEGLSPHAPFTVSPSLFAELGQIARRRRLPLSMHWSETEDEVAWLRDGSGPLAALLGPSPRRSGLDLLADGGLLRAPLSLVHGNHPARGEAERIAAAGAVVVHCPGSHAWFERAPFPLRHFQRRGVVLALGTDSLASNEQLDMRREMARLRITEPALAPAFVWEMATRNAARALGASGAVGELTPGACADLVAFGMRAESRDDALEQLTSCIPAVEGVWIAGRAVFPASRRRAPARGAR